MKCELKKEIKKKSGEVIPAGTSLHVYVERENPMVAWAENASFKVRLPSASLQKYFDEFDEFGMDELEEAMFDGICPSLTGESIEPDGWDSEGFPSILIASGLC
jgi:hypothetical protein